MICLFFWLLDFKSMKPSRPEDTEKYDYGMGGHTTNENKL